MNKVLGVAFGLAVASTVVGCGGIVAGRNARAARAEFSKSTGCEEKESKPKNVGKVDLDRPNVVGANKIHVEGCGSEQDYLCAVIDTGGGTSDVICERAK